MAIDPLAQILSVPGDVAWQSIKAGTLRTLSRLVPTKDTVEVAWSDQALADLVALDSDTAKRIVITATEGFSDDPGEEIRSSGRESKVLTYSSTKVDGVEISPEPTGQGFVCYFRPFNREERARAGREGFTIMGVSTNPADIASAERILRAPRLADRLIAARLQRRWVGEAQI